MTSKISRTFVKRENQSWTIFWIIWTKNLGRLNELSHTAVLHAFGRSFRHLNSIYIKCLWQHPSRSYNLDFTKIELSEISDPIVITTNSLSYLQPGTWRIPIRPRSETLTILLSAPQDFTKFHRFNNTHPLTRHIVKELLRHCQSSVSDGNPND